jgi:NAD(P)-dependent dehydrogenase (short-subunit alcohol dehydrogenase family)
VTSNPTPARASWKPDLRDRTAIVTGASSGIGVATAGALAEAGANLMLVGRSDERLRQTVEAVRATGRGCDHVRADLTDDDAFDRIVTGTLERFGSIDCLVHNAGIFEFRPFIDTPVEVLDEQYRTNVRAPYALTRAAVPHMAPGSTIIFVTSNATNGNFENMAAYAASKGGEESLSRALALELAPRGIRVNAVAPGITRTPMTSRIDDDPELEDALVRLTPLGRLGQPEDIAAAVVFLSSPASSYALGAVLTVDGGWTIH